jgi:hypothetical protein
MKPLTLVLCLLLASVVHAQQTVTVDDHPDDLAKKAIDVLAGPAWERARYFAFTFAVERGGQVIASFPQRWDRFTGDYRVEGLDQRGDRFLIIMNTKSKQGKAWKNGVEATGTALAEFLDFGYKRFANDTYWLLMPLKSMDPGVKREGVGERTDSCGRTWDVVKLTFDKDSAGGLAPGDTYWMWINRDTGIVEEWDMKVEGSNPNESPTSIYFHDYKRVGNILISTRREVRGKNQSIRLDNVVITPDVPPGAFKK